MKVARLDILPIESLKVVHSFRGIHGDTYALAFSPDSNNTLATGSDDDTIRLWDVRKAA